MARGAQVPCRRILRERGDSFLPLTSPCFGAALGHEFYRDARDQRHALHRPCRSLPDLLLPRLHKKVETPFDQDSEEIREVVATWMRATAKGDLETVFSLIAEDAVFLLPDQPPMRGREAFAAALRSALGQVRIEGKPDIQEIHVAGDYAFCWNQLSLTVTPLQGGPARRRAGPTLSVFRKEPDGRWILFRDANMLKAV
jgi:uncharacterized protein (TIGR02246 family)